MKKEKTEFAKPHLDHSLNSVWIDNILVAAREDDICLMRFFTAIPEGVFEKARFMTNKEQLKDFISTLCQVLDYYPTKDDKKQTMPESDKAP